MKDLRANACPDIKVFLIGNKVDLEGNRVVLKETAQKFKDNYDIDLFMETSAKSGFNTQELFVEAAKLLYKDYQNYLPTKKKEVGETLIKKVNEDKKKRRCCS